MQNPDEPSLNHTQTLGSQAIVRDYSQTASRQHPQPYQPTNNSHNVPENPPTHQINHPRVLNPKANLPQNIQAKLPPNPKVNHSHALQDLPIYREVEHQNPSIKTPAVIATVPYPIKESQRSSVDSIDRKDKRRLSPARIPNDSAKMEAVKRSKSDG